MSNLTKELQEIYIESAGEILKILVTSAEAVRAAEESEKFMWPSKCIYLLLQNYEKRMTEFSSGTKRHSKIWDNIASDMNKVTQVVVTGTQCQSKMNGLKKMYKKVLDHNNISGNDRKSWPYFERMHEIFGTSGWANPKALASEAGPLSSENSNSDKENNKDNGPSTKKLKMEKALPDFLAQMKQDRQKKEKIREERKLVALQQLKDQKEKHHQEKMDIMRKFCEAIAGKKLFD